MCLISYQMYNFDADCFLILYPPAAGGNFLAMLLSLDKDAAGLDGTPQKENLLDYYTEILKTNKYNAHLPFNGPLAMRYMMPTCQNFESLTIDAKKYIFAFHPFSVDDAMIEFFKKCKNLKTITISTSTKTSKNILQRRDLKLWRRSRMPSVTSNYHHIIDIGDAEPTFTIELEDFWNPAVAVPILNKFFSTHNFKIENWESLYMFWYEKMIK